jgi:hypothetical protein
MLRPAKCAITLRNVYIVVPEVVHTVLGQRGEFGMALDGVHLVHNATQNRGGISGTGANF